MYIENLLFGGYDVIFPPRATLIIEPRESFVIRENVRLVNVRCGAFADVFRISRICDSDLVLRKYNNIFAY